MTEMKSYRVLSGSVLKLLALLTMFLDHGALFFLPKAAFPLFTVLGRTITLHILLRLIGRMAFPLYCFLLVEGFLHTSNRNRYGADLLLFALVSEVPWDLLHTGTLFSIGTQNVFFTLFLGYCVLCLVEWKGIRSFWKLLILGGVIYFCTFIHMDYGLRGVALILLLYLLRSRPLEYTLIGSCILGDIVAPFCFLPTFLYNGKRGFIRRKWAKYLFYIAYPLHLMLIYILLRFS